MEEVFPGPLRYSIVIPVYNSESIVSETVRRTIAVFESIGSSFEIVLVNDGSTDGSWSVVEKIARDDDRVTAIDLLKNYGQHTAVLCGFEASVGTWVLTIDDDLQNPPEELIKLIEKAHEGEHDLVIGRFAAKRHAPGRRLGSRLINRINKKIFGKPDDLVLTNVRCVHRSVVERVNEHRTPQPYINGLTLLYSSNPVNVLVEHQPRTVGKSGYTLTKIMALVFRILFNYSSWPLRFVSNVGLIATAASLAFGLFTLIRAAAGGTSVPGWASVAVLLAFFNGVSLLILSMLGEYTVRLLSMVSESKAYHVRTKVE